MNTMYRLPLGAGWPTTLAVTLALFMSSTARAMCENDMQCKGDRICDTGRCVSPNNRQSDRHGKALKQPAHGNHKERPAGKIWNIAASIGVRPGAAAKQHSWCATPGTDEVCNNGHSFDSSTGWMRIQSQLLLEIDGSVVAWRWAKLGFIGRFAPTLVSNFAGASGEADFGTYRSLALKLGAQTDVGGRFSIEPFLAVGSYWISGGPAADNYHSAERALCRDLNSDEITCVHREGDKSGGIASLGVAAVINQLMVPIRVAVSASAHSRVAIGETVIPTINWEFEEHLFADWSTFELAVGVQF
jgi:hypothetical protein